MIRRKSRWRSKTYWVNLAVLLLAAAEAKLSLLQPSMRADVYGWAAFILPLVNLALREMTSTGVGK